MKKISIIRSDNTSLPTRKKVAAYARVSMGSEDALHSLSAQVSFYNDLIQSNNEWDYAGVYADEGISGTRSENRKEFQRMLCDCENGKIDIILTKSISRFARNTVNLLETVRYLRDIGVEVRFEREKINSLDGEGELMLSILSSFAQEESRSISENIKWGIRRRFESGHIRAPILYGYRSVNGTLEIEPREAEIVRLIFENFLNGKTIRHTVDQLAEMGVKGYYGNPFTRHTVRDILRQEKYTGSATLQRWFIENHITHRKRRNRGELPMYWVENSHEAIIDAETFNKVRDMISERCKLGIAAYGAVETGCFTGRIRCAKCGRSYRRYGRYVRCGKRRERASSYWGCSLRKKGLELCDNENIDEEHLKAASALALDTDVFDEKRFAEEIDKILVAESGLLQFVFNNGKTDMIVDWRNL